MRRCLLVLLAACSGPANTTLADLPDLAVYMTTSRQVDLDTNALAPMRLEVRLDYNTGAFRASHGNACATLDEVSGTFNGTPLVLEEAGDAGTGDITGCQYPVLAAQLELGASATGDLAIDDATHTITAQFLGRDAAARIAAPISHPAWAFASGDSVSMSWSRPEELVLFDDGRVSIELAIGGTTLEAAGIATTGSEVQFVLPPTDLSGDGTITMLVQFDDYSDAQPRACIGASRCMFVTDPGYSHAVRLN